MHSNKPNLNYNLIQATIDGTNVNAAISEVDVVVVGGGCAGMECARELYTHGFKNLVVLEAQDYIGGRIKTTFINDDESLPLEMGANWIHGLVGNPLYDIAKQNPDIFQFKKKWLFSDDKPHCCDEYGRVYDRAMVLELYDLYREWNLDGKSLWIDRKKSTYSSYTDFMVHKLEEHIANDPEETKVIKRAILRRLLKAETLESGCATMDIVSINEYGSYTVPSGPNLEFPGGYSSLIQFLADHLPKTAVKLNHAVKNIRTMPNDENFLGVSPNLLVECENGALFKTGHVVVTCSVNFLKKNYLSMFEPKLLTEDKIEAINTVKMDTVDKIFLFYDDMSFFPANSNTLHPVFIDARETADLSNSWFYKTFAFEKFYDNMLLVWITGSEAKYVENLDNDIIGRQLTDLLRRILNNKNVPLPSRVFKTTWNKNPYILGSYSYIDLTGSAIKHINNLAEPIYINGKPKIQFAGEATHLRFYSTVHGAYLSGQREAKRLYDYYKMTQQ